MASVKKTIKLVWAFLWRWFLLGLLIRAAIDVMSICVAYNFNEEVAKPVCLGLSILKDLVPIILIPIIIIHIRTKRRAGKFKF